MNIANSAVEDILKEEIITPFTKVLTVVFIERNVQVPEDGAMVV